MTKAVDIIIAAISAELSISPVCDKSALVPLIVVFVTGPPVDSVGGPVGIRLVVVGDGVVILTV